MLPSRGLSPSRSSMFRTRRFGLTLDSSRPDCRVWMFSKCWSFCSPRTYEIPGVADTHIRTYQFESGQIASGAERPDAERCRTTLRPEERLSMAHEIADQVLFRGWNGSCDSTSTAQSGRADTPLRDESRSCHTRKQPSGRCWSRREWKRRQFSG